MSGKFRTEHMLHNRANGSQNFKDTRHPLWGIPYTEFNSLKQALTWKQLVKIHRVWQMGHFRNRTPVPIQSSGAVWPASNAQQENEQGQAAGFHLALQHVFGGAARPVRIMAKKNQKKARAQTADQPLETKFYNNSATAYAANLGACSFTRHLHAPR